MLALTQAAALDSPNRAALQIAFAKGLEGVGRADEAIARLAAAAARLPRDEPLDAALAAMLGRAERFEEALSRARDWPGSPWAARLALKLLMRQKRFEDASAREEAVAAADPANSDLLDLHAMRLRAEPEVLLRLCERALEHRPGACAALYWKAVALALLGRLPEAADLMGLERVLRIAPLAAPTGFGGDEAFRAALRGEILGNPTLHADPVGHASSEGTRTRTFPMPGDVAATALLLSIRGAVAAYADEFGDGHDLGAARPARATLNAWALIFRGAGRQFVHHHPESWLTGVYYVAAGAGPGGGAIRIGARPAALRDVDAPWQPIEIEPVPGTLILFPSYVPHETLPPERETERISVAFDVAAAPGKG